MKLVKYLLVSIPLFTCLGCNSVKTDLSGFNNETKTAIQEFVKKYKNQENAYVVSDFDNTTVIFDIALQSSKKEQDAIDCERDVDRMKMAQYMENHIGSEFDGIISGVTQFGFFVELANTCEGLVRLDSIGGDYYAYNKELSAILGKNTKKTYMYGDKVRVKVVGASRETSQIDFELVGEYNEKEEKKTKPKKN